MTVAPLRATMQSRRRARQAGCLRYIPPRSLEAIDADLDAVTSEIMDLLREVHS